MVWASESQGIFAENEKRHSREPLLAPRSAALCLNKWFIVEFFRYDRRGTLFGIDSLSPQQLLSLGLAAVFVALLVRDEWREYLR